MVGLDLRLVVGEVCPRFSFPEQVNIYNASGDGDSDSYADADAEPNGEFAT